jgi:Domain of Unknown Function (DUF748)
VNQHQQDPKQAPGKHRWLRRSALAVIIIAAIIALARLTLPYSIILGATSWLEKQGVQSSIEDIRIDVIGGKFTLINATGTIDQKPVFKIGLIDIRWLWKPLSDKVIHIERVTLDNFDVDIAQYSDAITIAGVTFPLGSDTPPPATPPDDNDAVSWAASLSEVGFSNLDVCYRKYESAQTAASASTPALDYCTKFSRLGWNGNIGFATDRDLDRESDVPLVSEGTFVLSDFSVTDGRLSKTLLDAHETRLDHVSIKGLNHISIDELDIDGLSALQRDDTKHRDAVRFNKLHIAGIHLKNINTLDIDSIRLDAPGLFIAKDAAGIWEYDRWIPRVAERGEKNDRDTADSHAFQFALNRIEINDSDFCYDDAGRLYYCLNLASLDWKGSAAFVKEPVRVTGELRLAGLSIHNRTLQRDLLNIKQLSASEINISKADNVKLGSLIVDNLSALQRTEKPDDNSLKFKRLDIASIAFTDNRLLNIGKIELDGIGVSLSKNKDGTWEYDKWKTTSKDDTNASPPATPETADTGRTIEIALGEFSLTTDQNVGLRDESMSPALDLGLKKIDFDIKQLDSNKADQHSPFKLSAATTRHGTINIAGFVSPFEPKPSFNAKGKIKGIDLRAISPATKKYVGHIIRSGQLDADLKLLSKNGQLDSNVGLVLQQFELKAMSAKDAKELEQTFGMPINQSLSLLRDKDNSIHLDIPITGDVTAPDFDPTDAIIKATTKATSFTLITFFTPYGLAYAGGNILFDLATALNFDPLIFDPGSATLNKSGTDQLDKLAKLLAERPQVHLTLCGTSNASDRMQLYPDVKPADGAKPAALNPEQEARLLQLASDRQNNTKEYLINSKAIAHDRLILCEPVYDADKDAIGGVEINI